MPLLGGPPPAEPWDPPPDLLAILLVRAPESPTQGRFLHRHDEQVKEQADDQAVDQYAR